MFLALKSNGMTYPRVEVAVYAYFPHYLLFLRILSVAPIAKSQLLSEFEEGEQGQLG
jgi:hypothetical protein